MAFGGDAQDLPVLDHGRGIVDLFLEGEGQSDDGDYIEALCFRCYFPKALDGLVQDGALEEHVLHGISGQGKLLEANDLRPMPFGPFGFGHDAFHVGIDVVEVGVSRGSRNLDKSVVHICFSLSLPCIGLP